MDFNHIYGAGFRHGQIKIADGTVYDIDAIIGIEGDPQQEDTTIQGDDSTKATFSSSRSESLTVTANAISMDVFAAITGNTVSDVMQSTTKVGVTMPLGTQAELNPPFVELEGVINAKTDQGTDVMVKKSWLRVQLNKVKINGSNGSEMSVELSGTAIQTDKDITGTAVSPSRVANLTIETGNL